MKAPSLLIHGSLALKGARRLLTAAKEPVHVLEMDTLLPPDQRPRAAEWLCADDLFSTAEMDALESQMDDLLEFYLQESAETAEVPVSRLFRAASLGMQCRKWVLPYLVNLRLAGRLLESGGFRQVTVAPGSGISFRAWRQACAHFDADLAFLPVEHRPFSLTRKWARLRQRRRVKAMQPALPQKAGLEHLDVLCASTRVGRMIASEAGAEDLRWRMVPEAPAEDSGPLRAHYLRWWPAWEAAMLGGRKDDGLDPRSILRDLGRMQAAEVYPRFALHHRHARAFLEKHPPRLLLCDTQEGSLELAWAVAARELGIPTAALTYDHVIQPRLCFRPDHLLSDSGRHDWVALQSGYSEPEIVRVQSHRKPAPLSTETAGGNVVLYADSYYSGTTARVTPQWLHRNYRILVEAARLCPQLEFRIKFHPLRDRKGAEQCFTGIDEDDLHVRNRCLKALNPPANLRLLAPEESMLEHLRGAFALVNSNSTAGLEAFALGIPVVFLRRPHPASPGFPEISRYEACEVAETPAALAEALRNLSVRPDFRQHLIQRQRAYIEDFYWPQDRQPLLDGLRCLL
jgi:hypothetical protein